MMRRAAAATVLSSREKIKSRERILMERRDLLHDISLISNSGGT